MITAEQQVDQRRSGLLVVLLLATFVAGSAELLTVGLLPLISPGLGVSVAVAGSLFSAYAVGLAVGGPLLTVLTIRRDRRQILIGAMTLFALMVIAPAVWPDFGWFLLTRVIAGALQGVIMAAAFTTATATASPDRVGRALSVVIAGFAIATVVGLPVGVLTGTLLGWRGALAVVGGSALLVAGVFVTVLPSVPGSERSSTSELRQVASPPVLAVLALSLLLFAAPGAVMAYLMPLLAEVTGLSGAAATAVLVAFGIASVAGSFVGGRLADHDPARALMISTVGLAAAFVILYVARAHPLVAVLAIMAWAVFASSAPPSVQYRAVSLAGPGGAVVASLPASAASAGIALGSTASGLAYAAAGPSAVIITGVLLALGAAALAVATRRLRPPTDDVGDQRGLEFDVRTVGESEVAVREGPGERVLGCPRC